MPIVVLTSPGGSPGVTVTALALTLTWPHAAVLTECDPAGGAVLAGLWRGEVTSGPAGLLEYALAAQRDPAAAADVLLTGAMPLENTPAARAVLPALPGPAAARQMAGAWPAVTASFRAAQPDVVADVGRFDADPALTPLLAHADQLLMVCRPTITQAAAARPRLELLTRIRPVDGLILIGTGAYGADAARVFAKNLGIRVAATVPSDATSARVLSDGAPHGRRFSRSPLMNAARGLAASLARDARTAAQPAGSRR